VRRLKAEGKLACLQLLHFHSGSQITSIREVKDVMRESSYLYAELVKARAGASFGCCGLCARGVLRCVCVCVCVQGVCAFTCTCV
jgi:hypothetical protein